MTATAAEIAKRIGPTPWLAPPPKTDPRIRSAQKRARRAIRAGRQEEADRWARYAMMIAAEVRRRNKAAAIGKTQRMPVLLDPKGYSPSGRPNWAINMLRLERAGLLSLHKY
jgi:hypothetical protein